MNSDGANIPPDAAILVDRLVATIFLGARMGMNHRNP